MAEWSQQDGSLYRLPAGFPHCFDTVGWVIWSIKIIPEMSYNELSGTLSSLVFRCLCKAINIEGGGEGEQLISLHSDESVRLMHLPQEH